MAAVAAQRFEIVARAGLGAMKKKYRNKDGFPITFFEDEAATQLTATHITFAALSKLIHDTEANSKLGLPWLKLAVFGKKRTVAGSLRHKGNVVAISGIEADYDAEEIPFDEAVKTLRKARINALIYTSPSYTKAKPRWRVLAPTSALLPAEMRTKLMARLNGLFGGVFAAESFKLSQSYFYGAVVGNAPPRVAIVPGFCIDQRHDLDAHAIGNKHAANPQNHKRNQQLIADDIDMVAAAVGAIPNDFEPPAWVPWKNFGMAVWGATGGEGFDIFDEFSQRWECGFYDKAATRFCWREICSSPPQSIGAGTIFYMADKASPEWRYIYEQTKWRKILIRMRMARA